MRCALHWLAGQSGCFRAWRSAKLACELVLPGFAPYPEGAGFLVQYESVVGTEAGEEARV